MKAKVCGDCAHFRPNEPYGLSKFSNFTIWRVCVARKCGVMADTTAAETCEKFQAKTKKKRGSRGKGKR